MNFIRKASPYVFALLASGLTYSNNNITEALERGHLYWVGFLIVGLTYSIGYFCAPIKADYNLREKKYTMQWYAYFPTLMAFIFWIIALAEMVW